MLDPTNPVVQLCAAGMDAEGDPPRARALFEAAWAARRDDLDASIAAHYLARHQPTPADTLAWNERALAHADRLEDDRAAALLPSLCLNLAESYRQAGRAESSEALARRGMAALTALPADGYTAFVHAGLERVLARLGDATS